MMADGGEAQVAGPERTTTADTGDDFEAVLVTAPRCHLCDDAKHLLKEMQHDYPLIVREVELSSDEGMALSRRFSMPFPPLLLIDGVRFGHGRISRRKLVRLLDQRSGRGS
jgi:Glutaredoxin-like domain (DUF836)